MRIATLIISLVLMLGLFLQSCVVLVGGSLSEEFSAGVEDRREAQDVSGGGAVGVFAAFLWLIGAALVISKPKASMWIFIVGTVFCLLGGSSGFSDLYFWAVASAAFALMSYFGIREKAQKDEQEQARYRADVQAAAAAQQQPSPPA